MPKKNNQKNKQKGGFWPFSTETKVDASGNPVAAAPAEPESGGWFSYFKPKGDAAAPVATTTNVVPPVVAAPVVPPAVAAPVVPPAAAATNTGIVGGKKRNKSKKSKKSKKNRSKKH
jgi:hypothetical protein